MTSTSSSWEDIAPGGVYINGRPVTPGTFTEALDSAMEQADRAMATRHSLTYAERCAWAATNQGLDPVVASLGDADIFADVEQTGGFTMVAVVTCVRGHVAIVDDGDAYLVGTYPGDSWHEGPAEMGETVEALSTEDMVNQVRAAVVAFGGEVDR